MIRCWRLALKACELEMTRIAAALGEEPGSNRGGRGNRRPSNNRRRGGGTDQRKIEKLIKDREQTLKTYIEFRKKVDDYGFHIADPDIDSMRDAGKL